MIYFSSYWSSAISSILLFSSSFFSFSSSPFSSSFRSYHIILYSILINLFEKRLIFTLFFYIYFVKSIEEDRRRSHIRCTDTKIYSTTLHTTSLAGYGSGPGTASGEKKKNRLNTILQNPKNKVILSKSIDGFESKYKNY